MNIVFDVYMYKIQLDFKDFFLNVSFPYYALPAFGAIVFLMLPSVIVYQYEVIAETSNSSISTNTNMTSNTIAQDFHKSYEILINNSHLLTQQYQKEVGKWQSKQYDNKTMISVTDNYLPKFENLVNKAKSLQPNTSEYLQASILYIKSLQSEIESYKHFQNFLVTGNKTEDEISSHFLSDALKYEIDSFAAFNNNGINNDDRSKVRLS